MRRSSLVVSPDGRAACAALGVHTAPDLLAVSGGIDIARSRTRSTVRLETSDGPIYLKRYVVPTWGHWWRGALRWTWVGPSKARREWQNAGRLRALGWETPDCLALAEVRTLGALRACALMTRAVEDAERLDACLWRLRDLGPDGRHQRLALLEALAVALRRIHGAGYVDRNMHPRNVLVRWDGDVPSFVKVDSPRGRRWPWVSTAAAAGDLAALDAVASCTLTRAERLRFVRCYTGGGRAGARERRMVQAVARRRERSRRREEPRVAEARAHVAA